MDPRPLALVIESDAGTRRLLDVLIGRVGLQADLMANGADALLLLQHIDYDVIVLDLLLPMLSGPELLQWLAIARPAALERAIVVSSAPDARLEEVRRRWPQLRVIRKPFELEELVDAVQSAAAKRTGFALTPATAFCRRSVLAGAKAGVIVRVRGTSVEPLATFGYSAEHIAPFLAMSIDDPYPLCASIRSGAPQWCGSIATAQLEHPILWAQDASRAFAVVPIERNGAIAGAAAWTYREPRLFGDGETRTLLDIAARAAELIVSGDAPAPVVTVRS